MAPPVLAADHGGATSTPLSGKNYSSVSELLSPKLLAAAATPSSQQQQWCPSQHHLNHIEAGELTCNCCNQFIKLYCILCDTPLVLFSLI
jgi:hypothetical protein